MCTPHDPIYMLALSQASAQQLGCSGEWLVIRLVPGTQVRRQAGDWVKAANQVLDKADIVAGLFRQYADLKDLATDYATKIERSTWRKDQGSLGQEVMLLICKRHGALFCVSLCALQQILLLHAYTSPCLYS